MSGVYEEYYWFGYDTTFLLHAASCVEFTRNIIGLGVILLSYYMQHHVWIFQGISVHEYMLLI